MLSAFKFYDAVHYALWLAVQRAVDGVDGVALRVRSGSLMMR